MFDPHQIRHLEAPADLAALLALQAELASQAGLAGQTGLARQAGLAPPAGFEHLTPTWLVTHLSFGGLALGAFVDQRLVGYVVGTPGSYLRSGESIPMLISQVLVVHPDMRNTGVGYALKRAQWQMARHQGIQRISWFVDPLNSPKVYLDFGRLGGVSSTLRSLDFSPASVAASSAGTAGDILQVDWWTDSVRVFRRLSRRARRQLDLAHYFSAGVEILNPSQLNERGLPVPAAGVLSTLPARFSGDTTLLLVEIPAHFPRLSAAAPDLAQHWRQHITQILSHAFASGYMITDFLYLAGENARGFYLLSQGNITLDG